MSDFHDRLHAVQAEVWDAGPDATPALDAMMHALDQAHLPQGIVRLSSARMAGGQHLAPQPEPEEAGAHVLRFEAIALARRIARQRLHGHG
ncbi:MAG: hypothetical protein AAFR47_08120 [Pseudomonadota bacterium]